MTKAFLGILIIAAILLFGCKDIEFTACRDACQPAPVLKIENGSCYCVQPGN